jgi:hypothetical protein
MIAAGCLGFLWRHLKARVSRTWPLVDARFEGGNVTRTGSRRRAYLLELSYSYTVEGHIYGGQFRRKFRSEDEAHSLLRNLQQFGIRVRDDPRAASRSAFEPDRDI